MKKLFVIIAIAFAFLLAQPVSAFQFQSNEEYRREGNEAMQNHNPSFGPMTTFNASLLVNNAYCFAAGKDACPESLITMNPNFGLIPQTVNASLAILTNPPANTGIFLADMGQTLGFIPKSAYAQGVGFSGLSPLLGIWKAFRNIAYVLVSIMLIIVGFLIMFRKNIDPHTVINIQSAIPRIIISLILITFSYAIVGLMIDAMYVILLVAFGVFNASGILPLTRDASFYGVINTEDYNIRNTIMNGGLIETVGSIFPSGLTSISNLVGALLGGQGLEAIRLLFGAGGALLAIPFAFPFGSIFLGAIGAIAGPPIIELMAAFLIAILWIKLFFLLIGAYIQLLMRLIFGPLQIATGIIPGNNGFINWFRSVASQLAIFLVAGLMFMVAISFSSIADTSPNTPMWKAPFLNIGGDVKSIATLFSIGVLFLIPTIAKQVQAQIAGQGGQDVNATGAVLGGLSNVTGLGMQAFNLWRSRSIPSENNLAAIKEGTGVKDSKPKTGSPLKTDP